MISFKGCLENIVTNLDGTISVYLKQEKGDNPYELTDNLKTLAENAKKGLKIEISAYREHRSLDANAYAWVLMDKIAKEVGNTKEEVYREIITKVGVFDILPIKNVAVESFKRRWEQHGLGWVCQIERESTLPNYTVVTAYYGTSTYNTEEMSRFIEEVIFEAKKYGIQTATPDELADMKNLWEQYNAVNNTGK